MIKNILIYIAVLAISFSFAVFYYAWFSNFLLIVVLCLPVLSLLCSLPFMIYSAVKGFSIHFQCFPAYCQSNSLSILTVVPLWVLLAFISI